MKTEIQYRKAIFEKVKALYKLRKSREKFIFDRIEINYTGRKNIIYNIGIT